MFTMSSSNVAFLDKIKGMKLTEFSFTKFSKELSSKGEDGKRMTYLVFELETAIPKVESSVTEWDPGSGKRVHDFKTDVTKVRCKLEVIEQYADEFKFDEDKAGKLTLAGSYAGDLFLDLARSNEVWLTDDKFSKMSSEYKQGKRSERIMNILKRTEEQAKS